MLVTLTLGDFWADGHGIHRDFQINVPDVYSVDDLRENFKKTVELLGVNPKKFASSYQDSTAYRDDIQKLIDAGFPLSEDSELFYYFGKEDYAEEETIYLDEDSFVDILMFFYGYGLEGFGWQKVPAPPQLNEEMYGYGLFSF